MKEHAYPGDRYQEFSILEPGKLHDCPTDELLPTPDEFSPTHVLLGQESFRSIATTDGHSDHNGKSPARVLLAWERPVGVRNKIPVRFPEDREVSW